MAFTWQVIIDGSDLSELVEDGATITYGRRSLLEQPSTPTAVLRLLTRDAWPDAAGRYPEFGLGDWASDLSGFTDDYADVMAGVKSRVTIGVPVSILANTPSGFTDEYVDEYASGVNFTRFTGRVQAIDYSYEYIQLTCTPRSEEWARILVGGTEKNETIPAETEAARAIRYAAEAGVTLIVDGAPTVEVVTVPEETPARPLMEQLLELMQNTGGVIFTDRNGWVNVRTVAYDATQPQTVELPPGVQLRDPLVMQMELGLVRNRITLEYGEPPIGNKLRPTATVQDQESVSRYGLRDYRASTPIQNQPDALLLANRLLALLQPYWSMPDAVGALALGDDAALAALCGLELGDLVLTPALPLGAPAPSYTSSVLGYTETVSRIDWQLELHLSPQLTQLGD